MIFLYPILHHGKEVKAGGPFDGRRENRTEQVRDLSKAKAALSSKLAHMSEQCVRLTEINIAPRPLRKFLTGFLLVLYP